MIPAPFVELSGLRLSGTATADAPVVLAALGFTWGRSDMFAQPAPGTGRVRIFDPSGVWGTGTDPFGRPDLVGDTCDLGWTIGATERYCFRGVVSEVAVAPHTADGHRGALLTLDLVARLTELASMDNASAWPDETAALRAARLETLVEAPGGVADLQYPGGSYGLLGLRYRAARERTLLQGLADLYDQATLRMSFLPHTKTLRGIGRRAYPSVRGLVGLRRAPGRDGTGAYLGALAVTAPGTGETTTAGLFIDGTRLIDNGAGGWATRGISQRITKVEVKGHHLTSPGPPATYTDYVARRDLTRTGRRTERVASLDVESSSRTGGNWAESVADDLAAMVTQEGAAWIPEPLVLDLGLTELETVPQAEAVLGGGETAALVFLQRTLFPQVGIRPVFGIMGGSAEYDQDGWRITLNPAPVHTPEKQHPISWAEIDDGTAPNTLRWYLDGADHTDALHESVTFEDMTYCATGLGVTTPGPDTGWDAYL